MGFIIETVLKMQQVDLKWIKVLSIFNICVRKRNVIIFDIYFWSFLTSKSLLDINIEQ